MIITHVGIHKVKIEHNNKQKMCKFFVGPGNGQALPNMPYIETLKIIHINCYTKLTEPQTAVQTQQSARFQGMNNTMQT